MATELVDRFGALRAQRRVDVRAGAVELRVPEAELFAAHTDPDRIRLSNDWTALLHGLPSLGQLRFHTDGRLGLHRLDTRVETVRVGKNAAILQGDTADLRLLLSRWSSAWAVMHDQDGFAELGIHIHDNHGDPVLRIVQTLRTDRRAMQKLVVRLRAPHQNEPLPLTQPPDLPAPVGLSPNLRQTLLEAWPHLRGMRGLGELLRHHGLRRPDAYALVSPVYAQPVEFSLVRRLLETAVGAEVPLAISIGNRACVQSHRGIIDHLSHPCGWLTIRDPSVFIHLNPSVLDSVWVVRRPSEGGTHILIELLGPGGDLLGTIRSLRVDHQPEDWRWRRMVGAELRAALP
jgi:putative hemin transport protein